jgi:hypothetical protein
MVKIKKGIWNFTWICCYVPLNHFQILDLTTSGSLNMKKKYRYQRKNRSLEADEMSALLLTIKYCYRRDIIEKMIATGMPIFLCSWNSTDFVNQRWQYQHFWLLFFCFEHILLINLKGLRTLSSVNLRWCLTYKKKVG